MKNFDKQIERIKKLPRQKGFVLAGGKRQLGLFVQNSKTKEYFQPDLALWLDADNGLIRYSQPIEAQGDLVLKKTLQAMLDAIEVRMPAELARKLRPNPKPARPEKVIVNDKELADAAQQLLAPLNIPVEFSAEPIAVFEQAYDSLSRMMGATDNPQPPVPFSWALKDESHIPALFEAAYNIFDRGPWHYMGSDVPALVELGDKGPSPEVSKLYLVPMGNAGMVTGVVFYTRRELFDKAYELGLQATEDQEKITEAIERLREEGIPVERMSPEALEQAIIGSMGDQLELANSPEALAETAETSYLLTYEPRDEVDPDYLKWLRERKVKMPRGLITSFSYMDKGMQPRSLTEQEVTALVLTLNAFEGFIQAHGRALVDMKEPPAPHYHYSKTIEVSVPLKAEIKVTYPAPGYEDRHREMLELEKQFGSPDDLLTQMMRQMDTRGVLPDIKPKKLN